MKKELYVIEINRAQNDPIKQEYVNNWKQVSYVTRHDFEFVLKNADRLGLALAADEGKTIFENPKNVNRIRLINVPKSDKENYKLMKFAKEQVEEKEIEDEKELEELRIEFEIKYEKKPDKRWGIDKLKAEINKNEE